MVFTPSGHIRITDKNGRNSFEHVIVWEEHNGKVPSGYIIHHKNNNKSDNRIDNLEILDHSTHRRIHANWIMVNNIWTKPCLACGETKNIDDFNYTIRKNGTQAYYQQCKKCMKLGIKPKRKRRLGSCVSQCGYKIHGQDHTLEHITEWEKVNGKIPEGMQIHHINGNKIDNSIDNLLLVDARTHQRIHAGWIFTENIWYKRCSVCGEYKNIDTEYHKKVRKSRNGAVSHNSRCIQCHKEYSKKWYSNKKIQARNLNVQLDDSISDEYPGW